MLGLREARVEVLLIIIQLRLHPHKRVGEGTLALGQEVAGTRGVALGLEYLLALHIRVPSYWTAGYFQGLLNSLPDCRRIEIEALFILEGAGHARIFGGHGTAVTLKRAAELLLVR